MPSDLIEMIVSTPPHVSYPVPPVEPLFQIAFVLMRTPTWVAIQNPRRGNGHRRACSACVNLDGDFSRRVAATPNSAAKKRQVGDSISLMITSSRLMPYGRPRWSHLNDQHHPKLEIQGVQPEMRAKRFIQCLKLHPPACVYALLR
jgi:hypothetical protein